MAGQLQQLGGYPAVVGLMQPTASFFNHGKLDRVCFQDTTKFGASLSCFDG